MKKGWKIEKLGDVCDVLDSKRQPITKRDRVAGEYPYYGATGILDYVHEYIFDEKLVLIGEDGAKWESGEYTAFIAEGKYWVNNHAHVIRPDRSIVIDEWIVYFLYISDLHKYVTGLTVPKLNQEKMRSIEIPVPPLPEQQRIVSLLDEAFAGLAQVQANAERNLVNAREVFNSALLQIFVDGRNNNKWSMEKLQKYNKVVVGYVGPISNDYTESKDGVLLLSTKNISAKGIDLEKSTWVNRQFHERNKKSQLSPGDILVARHGNSGQAAVIPNAIEEAHALNVIVVKRSRTILSEYLAFLLNSGILENITKSKAGSVQAIINTSIIKDLVIPVPSFAEQRTLVKRLDALAGETRRLEEVYQRKIEDIEELRKSILQRAFSGEL